MIDGKLYQKSSDWWVGKKVRATFEIGNGRASLPAGTIFTVTRKFDDLHLISEPCGKCGLRLKITKVRIGSLEMVEGQDLS